MRLQSSCYEFFFSTLNGRFLLIHSSLTNPSFVSDVNDLLRVLYSYMGRVLCTLTSKITSHTSMQFKSFCAILCVWICKICINFFSYVVWRMCYLVCTSGYITHVLVQSYYILWQFVTCAILFTYFLFTYKIWNYW